MQYTQRYDAGITNLLQQLDDLDSGKRRQAREQLLALGRHVTSWLVVLLASRRCRLRREAARVLTGISDPRSVPALVTALTDEDAVVRMWAVEALARLGRPALIALLVLLIEHVDDPEMRDRVHEVLKECHDRRVQMQVAPLYRELSRAGGACDVAEAAERVIKTLV